jgi:hypothetical protein
MTNRAKAVLIEYKKKTYNIGEIYNTIYQILEGSHSGLVRPPAKRLP